MRPLAILFVSLPATAYAACSTGADTNREILMNPDHPVFAEPAPEVFRAEFETSAGPFTIEVHRDWAARGADRFYHLARLGFYDNQRIFRVRAGFIAQFGIPGDTALAAVWRDRAMPDDSVRASNTRGRVAYAMTGPDTRTTQLYINYSDDNARLDADGFAPIGEVVEGMDVVDRFYAEYDESAGGGMRGGQQGPLFAGGNAYLDEHYPELDRIVSVMVTVPVSAEGAEGAGGTAAGAVGASATYALTPLHFR